jgi:hypothetical protein
MSDPGHIGPPPGNDDPGDHGIQPDFPRPAPRRTPMADDDLIILGEEHVVATPPAPRPTAQRATHFIGRELAIRLPRPTLAFVFSVLAFAVLGLVGALVSGAIWQFGLVYLLAIGVTAGVYFSRRRTRTLRVTADGVELTFPNEQLAYDEMVEIHAADDSQKSGKNFPIHLLHEHGYITIPPGVEADSSELQDFLETQPIGRRSLPDVPAILRDFVKQQTSIHGADAVCVYRARVTHPPAPLRSSALWVYTTLAIVGAGLAVLGIVQRAEVLIVCGIGLALFMGMLCLLVAVHHRMIRPPIKNWQQAMLVIGPDGLAVVQGELEGELRWRELKNVKMGRGVAGASTGAARNAAVSGIHLYVAGAVITIADIYHWPLQHTMDQIERQRGSRAERR